MAYDKSDTRPPRIFISHAAEDSEFAKAIIVLLSALGVDKESILCTSESGLGIKAGRDWVEELKRVFIDFRTYVIIIHSSHLYKSPVSMNEMGAAWVIGSPVFSFLVNGFMESSMAGVFTSNHQAVLVGRIDISPYIDQLRSEVASLFELKTIPENEWNSIRELFIKEVSALPADKGVVKELFDLNQVEHVHIQGISPLNEIANMEEKDIRWADILKSVAPALRKPHTETAIEDNLKETYPGINEEDVRTIIDKLHQSGIAEAHTVKTEYDGISVAWCFTEKGRIAYERAMNLHLQPIYQERDKAQVEELMAYFSTYVMDDYLKNGPEYITDVLLISADAWKGIIGGSAFHIFNHSLFEVLKSFYELLFQMTGHGECYKTAGEGRYRLSQPSFGLINIRDDKTINWLYDNMPELKKRYRAFIEYIKKLYPDIDLKDTSTRFENKCK